MSHTPVQLYGPRSVAKPTLAPIAIHPYQMPPSPPTTPQPLLPSQSMSPQLPMSQPSVQPAKLAPAGQPASATVSAEALLHHRLHPDFVSNYALGEELGSGGFGFVVSAYERQTGVERAVKFILRHKVPAHAFVRDPQLGMIPMEIYVLKHVRHPNVIGFVDYFKDDTYFYLVMELHGTQWSAAAAGVTAGSQTSAEYSPALSQTSTSDESFTSLDSPIDEHPPRLLARRTSCDLFECIERHHNFEEPLAKLIFRQIVECVAYLDKLGVCHRDIKDENIVIDDQFRVKLIDFGSSVILPRHYGQNKPCMFLKFYGTLSFASPEILACHPYRAEPAEIWSLGVLLYTILFGEVPFHKPEMALLGHFAPPKIPVSSKCLHLISCMLQRSPDKRPTIHQVLMHPWFNEA